MTNNNFITIPRLPSGLLTLVKLFFVIQLLVTNTNALPAKRGSSTISMNFVSAIVDELAAIGDSSQSPKRPLRITVYPWNNHLSRPATMEWSKAEEESLTCKEIPSRWQGKVRSINTHDNCIVLFSRDKCRGTFRVIKVGSPSHNRLSDIDFEKKPTSARPCDEDQLNMKFEEY